MQDTNSIKKGPDEGGQISTSENITGIPEVSEKVLQITLDAGVQKDILINKIDYTITANCLYKYLSINRAKGTITIKKKPYINLMKILYLEIFQDIYNEDLNKNHYNTIINEGDILDIKLDGLYKDGKEIIKISKKD